MKQPDDSFLPDQSIVSTIKNPSSSKTKHLTDKKPGWKRGAFGIHCFGGVESDEFQQKVYKH